ncbi:DUF881 domain-containing protein [Cytobacillus sp. FSL W7-1323]|uniref:DUF881 domain-containing protein n=1 Tax=Cytobacillus TaxID=2675230 RepID=UPI00277E1526|nr:MULTISPECIES: DUF881 domain-containing protein [Cytobacillus]MDQ0184915.1 uncharacterized protein YlxW (UPF0749 family) [Cytobacillus kochii]MEA1851870.1 DUF881 domain-containing protein [Cytobacillus sp. OWB-43]MED1606399.1 DUF881 domain-containing protein [Cytobacillus kochii]
MNKKQWGFTIITVLIGVMLAIQFKTVKNTDVRDTRDTWQLREDLQNEEALRLELLEEIRSQEEKIAQYENNIAANKEEILRTTLDELKTEVGLTEKSGPGLILTIQPIAEELIIGSQVGKVTPDLLKRLLNELNRYGAKEVAIGGHRVINSTVIRDINNITKIDGYSIQALPLELRVIVENEQDAEQMYKRMQVSKSIEDFFIENLTLDIQLAENEITVPAYNEPIQMTDMKEAGKKSEGGHS